MKTAQGKAKVYMIRRDDCPMAFHTLQDTADGYTYNWLIYSTEEVVHAVRKAGFIWLMTETIKALSEWKDSFPDDMITAKNEMETLRNLA